MLKAFKAIAALLVFVAVYLLASTLIFFMVLYMNGGSVYTDMNWRAYGLAVFADAFAGYLGVVVGRAAGVWLVPYPARFVGITFIVLLGLIWVPLTLIYAMGGAGILFGGVDMRDWPPEGELGEYFSGLVRAVVAVISAWVMLVRRDAIADDVDTGSAEKPKAPSRNTEARSAPTADRVSPEVAAIYLKLDRLMLDEKAQVANLPEPFRSEVLKGADCDKIAGTAGEFGRDPRNPIPVNGPLGEVIYLTNLRTATSQKIMFHRLGSAANLDIFEIVSVDGTVWDFLCLDLYHPRKSRLAPAGYRIAAEADRKSLLFGGNEYVARFPEQLPDAIANTYERLLGLRMRTPEVREITERAHFKRPADHERAYDALIKRLAKNTADKSPKTSKKTPEADLRLTPTNPISAFQTLEALTPRGKAFIQRVWLSDRVQSGRQKSAFEALVESAGLTFETDWSCVLDVKVDYD